MEWSAELIKRADQARSLSIVLRDALHSGGPDQAQYIPAIKLLAELAASVYQQEEGGGNNECD